jgi:hypothetical protein
MGKAAIIYVVGLSLLVGYGLMNINANSTASMDTYQQYYGRTMAHNLAITGANIGTQLLTRNPTYTGNLLNQQFGSSGWYDMRLTKSGEEARIVSTARFKTYVEPEHPDGYIRDTVIAEFKRIPFSEYGWFTEKEVNGYVTPTGGAGPHFNSSDWKITGDSVYGWAHTNNSFNLGGRPYFNDKVTGRNAPTLMTVGGQRAPIYNAGYQWGITVTRPTANITNLKALAAGGNVLGLPLSNNDVGLTFQSNGNVRVRIPWNTGTTRDTTLPITSVTSNGVIGVSSGDLHISGTYQGQVTVCAFTGTGATANKGNVWIEGNTVANNSPRGGNTSSNDMLGIVAERMGYITRNTSRTAASVLNIDAAIYCHTGEFTAEQYWATGIHGRVSLFGGVTQQSAGSLGTFGSGGILTGFFYSIRHDDRFLVAQPPHFPSSDKYKLVTWWEN